MKRWNVFNVIILYNRVTEATKSSNRYSHVLQETLLSPTANWRDAVVLFGVLGEDFEVESFKASPNHLWRTEILYLCSFVVNTLTGLQHLHQISWFSCFTRTLYLALSAQGLKLYHIRTQPRSSERKMTEGGILQTQWTPLLVIVDDPGAVTGLLLLLLVVPLLLLLLLL